MALWAAGSGLVVPSPAADEPQEPREPFPITDPGHEPVPMGLGHEPEVQRAFDSPTVLFINFDGPFMNAGCGNDSVGDCSVIFPGVQFNESPSDAAKRAAIVQATREDVEDFGVIVVGERPPAGNPYAMVVTGTPAGGAPPGVGGVAPVIDCGNSNPNITSFNFLVNDGANLQATVIHQEAAHTWGLEHVDDSTDNLYPTAGGFSDPKYQDTCSQVVADTQLNPTTATCNAVHTQFCPANQQNSYQEMLLLFGPPIVDNVPPSVVIDAPTEGQVLDYEEDFELTITLDDDRRPQVLGTSILFDDLEAANTSLINSTHTFPVNGGDPPSGHGLSNGFHTIRVDITDEEGNPASATVTIEIVNSPFGDPAEEGTAGDETAGGGDSDTGDTPMGTGGDGPPLTGGDDGGEQGCGCRTSTPRPLPAALLLLVAAGLVRRRR